MAKSLKSDRPKAGENGGQCVAYAGVSCFGVRFGAYTAKDIWYNKVTNTGGALPYKRYNTMPSPPCCIVWDIYEDGHVGVIESSSGTGSNKKYTFSDSNRDFDEIVRVEENIDFDTLTSIIKNGEVLGYVKFN